MSGSHRAGGYSGARNRCFVPPIFVSNDMPEENQTMNIPPELEAEMIAKGATVTKKPVQVPQEQLPGYEGEAENLAALSFEAGPGELIRTIPLRTTSEVNARDWKARNRRTGEAWKAVSKAFGPLLIPLGVFGIRYANGRPIYIRFTRLGGRKLDRSNLPTATKAVEDALAFMLGADDGDPRWVASWDQEPGGPMGVRITLSLEKP